MASEEKAHKRRENGTGSVDQLPNGRWRGRVTIARGVRKTVYAATKTECQAAMRRAHSAAERGETLPDNRLTVETFLREWLSGPAERKLRPTTMHAYRHYVEAFLIPYLGRHRLAALRPEHIDGMLANARGPKGELLSPRTLQQIRGILRSALSWGERNGRVTRNVAKLSEPPRVERHIVEPITTAQAQALVAAATADPWGALYVLALDTGLRQGELLGLRWADVEGRALRVVQTRTAVNGPATFGAPKSATSRRSVAFSGTSERLLVAHRKEQSLQRLKAGRKWQDLGLVFTREDGSPLDGPTVTHRFQRFLEANGLPGMRFHDLRHASASLLLASGLPARAVADRLGHSTTRLTQDTYAHLAPLQGEAAERIEGIIGRA